MTELIKMCDCPEIQDGWEPKVGDRVYIKRHEVYGHIVQVEGDNIIHVESDEGQTYWRNTQNELIYIPSIENMLKKLGNRFESLKRIRQKTRMVGTKEGAVFHKSTGNHDDHKALIKAYMHVGHGKTWNGRWE